MRGFSALALGMDVFGIDRRPVGRVKTVYARYLLIDRTAQRDVYVPFEAIQALWHNQIVLDIPAGQVDAMHWLRPPLLSL